MDMCKRMRLQSTGQGIGLALCKDIIESHGGSITIDSELGKGTTVRFTLAVWMEGMEHGTRNNLIG